MQQCISNFSKATRLISPFPKNIEKLKHVKRKSGNRALNDVKSPTDRHRFKGAKEKDETRNASTMYDGVYLHLVYSVCLHYAYPQATLPYDILGYTLSYHTEANQSFYKEKRTMI